MIKEMALEQSNISFMLDKLGNLPTMPVAAQAVVDSFGDPDLGVDELAEKISLDEGMSARVLRISNSSFYGLSRRVASIHDAVVVLGFSSVRSLAMAVGLLHLFPQAGKGQFEHQAFWQHSLQVAAAARGLAGCCRLEAETAFTAGLLYDVGQMVLDTCLHQEFDVVLKRYHEEAGDLYALEQEMLGFDHAQVGAEVARRWNFPPVIQQVIQSHHIARMGVDEPLVCVVHLADLLVREMGAGASDDDMLARLPLALCPVAEPEEKIRIRLPEIRRMVIEATQILGD